MIQNVAQMSFFKSQFRMKNLFLLFVLFNYSCKKKEDYIDFSQTILHVENYLNCTECTENQLGEVVNDSINSKDIFVNLLLEGPTKPAQAKYENYLKNTYAKLQDYVKRHPKEKITLTEAQYVSVYMSNYVALCRVKSIEALTAINRIFYLKTFEKAQQKAKTEKWRPDIINAINKALAEIDKK